MKENFKKFTGAIGRSVRHWWILIKDLLKRIFVPLKEPPFVIYFLIIILGIGGLGFWHTRYYKNEQDKLILAQSLATYLIAIVSGAFADFYFKKKKSERRDKSGQEASETISSSLLAIALAVFLGSLSLGVYGLMGTRDNENTAYDYSIYGTILALLLWWIVNFDNVNLKETDSNGTYNAGTAVTDELAGEKAENEPNF